MECCYVLVETLQDMAYFNVLKTHYGNKVKCISKPQSQISYVNCKDIIPTYVPYNSALINQDFKNVYTTVGINYDFELPMSEYYKTLTPTVINQTISTKNSKFIVITPKVYNSLLVSYLIANKNLVILVDADISVKTYYNMSTLFSTKEELEKLTKCLVEQSSASIKQMAEECYNKFCLTDNVPNLDLKMIPVIDNIIHELPEDIFVEPITAKTINDDKGNQNLKLSQTKGPESLPNITVINLKLEPDANDQLATHIDKYNKCTTRYPKHKITYIVQQEQNLRTLVQQAETDIIVLESPSFIYLPHSLYAKVKLLLDNDYQCIATFTPIHYHLKENISYCQYSRYPDSGTIAFKKEYFLQYPDTFSADAYLYHNRINYVCNLPNVFNCVVVHHEPPPEGSENARIHNKLFDWDLNYFTNKLYRKISI